MSKILKGNVLGILSMMVKIIVSYYNLKQDSRTFKSIMEITAMKFHPRLSSLEENLEKQGLSNFYSFKGPRTKLKNNQMVLFS